MRENWFQRRAGASRRGISAGAARSHRSKLSIESLEVRCLLSVSGANSNDMLAQKASLAAYEGTSVSANGGATAKIGSPLTQVYQQYELAQASGKTFQPSDSQLLVKGNTISIDVVAAGSLATLKSDVSALGMQVTASAGMLVSGYIPISSLANVAALSSVNFAQPDYKPFTHTGSVTDQGDAAIRADIARSTFTVDGAGITIGIISDSFDTSGNGSYAADVASGDLPANVDIIADEAGGTDEGRAMAQIVHDVAPGANIDFAAAGDSDASMAQSIQKLVAAGANIIVDDIGFLDEPFFQDGVIAQAAEAAVASGVTYVSAAGNEGTDGYESAFVSSGVAGPNGGTLHNFGTAANPSTLQEIDVPVGGNTQLVFQWDQPFASLGSAGSTNDLDLTLVGADGTTVVASANTRNVGGDPLEILDFTNPGTYDLDNNGVPDTKFSLEIELVSGAAPGRMQYIQFGDGTIATFATNSATSWGHPNGTGVISVAASAYFMDPAFGTSPPEVENFSSLGGMPILFDTSGNRLASPEVRQHPDVTGPDGANTTFFGDDIPQDSDTLPNFFGTSAAAPHVAAVVALMMQEAGGPAAMPPSQINQILKDTAIDITSSNDPSNFPGGLTQLPNTTGYDFYSGSGLVDAEAAVTAVALIFHPPSPKAVDDAVATPTDTPVTVDVLANDIPDVFGTDAASVTIVNPPLNGTAVVQSDGSILYTPAPGFNGGDELTYTIADSQQVVSQPGTVIFLVGSQGSISGYAYVDLNGNGIKDPNEVGIAGVTETLSKTDGNYTYSIDQQTDANGFYDFTGLVQGTYTVTELHPAFFLKGQDTAGTPAPSVAVANDDEFTAINLPAGANAASYNFGEQGLRAQFVAAYLDRHAFFASSDVSLDNIDLGQGPVFLSFDSGLQGKLVATVQFSSDSPSDVLTLYDNNMHRVASAFASDGTAELDFTGTKAPYFLEVSGTGTVVSLSTVIGNPPARRYQNIADPADVNGDGVVTPLDALVLINAINFYGIGPVARATGQSTNYLDVNGDGFISPLDALLVINQLDQPQSTPVGTIAQNAAQVNAFDVTPVTADVHAAAVDEAISQFTATSNLSNEQAAALDSAAASTATATAAAPQEAVVKRTSFMASSTAGSTALDVSLPGQV